MPEIFFSCTVCKAEIEADFTMCGDTAQCPACGSILLVPMPGIEKGMTMAGFVLEQKLGSGGMGEVWLANQTAMDRKVALKILSPGLTNDKEFVDRFMQEVKMSGKMEHPNIVTAFDAGMDKGVYYLATSYIDGVELGDKLKIEKIIPEKEALKITLEIAEALRYAWEDFKILHRDIKPANIMLDKKGSAKLMDMGISKSISEDHNLTMTGMIVGTPYYMSPEQALSKPNLDFRADLYSLGATLYHMVTGEVPYDAETAVAILTKHITDPLPPPRETNPKLSEQCADLLEIMLAKNKNDRQKSWEDAIQDIKNVIDGKSPATPTPEAAATFTETQSFDRNYSPNYEERIKKFKKFKPKILDLTEDKSEKRRSVQRPGHHETKAFKKVDPAQLNKKRKAYPAKAKPKNNGKKTITIACIALAALLLLTAAAFLVINQLEKIKQNITKDLEIERVVLKLKKNADKLADKKQFEEAAEILKNYNGPHKKETAQKRKTLAAEYIEKQKSLEQNGNAVNSAKKPSEENK